MEMVRGGALNEMGRTEGWSVVRLQHKSHQNNWGQMGVVMMVMEWLQSSLHQPHSLRMFLMDCFKPAHLWFLVQPFVSNGNYHSLNGSFKGETNT